MIADNIHHTIDFCAEHFITIAQEAITARGIFSVALSGGTTPKQLFTALSSHAYRNQLDWNKVQLFWSDERSVPPDSQENNYRMAMDAGLSSLNIPPQQIFRMHAEHNSLAELEQSVIDYEKLIKTHLPSAIFDMVMLGMGEDGHTASLFPKTHGLHVDDRFVIANFIPQKNTWRMTLTYECINKSRTIVIYVFGKNKAHTLNHVFHGPYDPDNLPIQKIGTRSHKALWIVDTEALSNSINGKTN